MFRGDSYWLLLITFINANGRVNCLGVVNPEPEVPKLLYVALTLKTSDKFNVPPSRTSVWISLDLLNCVSDSGILYFILVVIQTGMGLVSLCSRTVLWFTPTWRGWEGTPNTSARRGFCLRFNPSAFQIQVRSFTFWILWLQMNWFNRRSLSVRLYVSRTLLLLNDAS